MHGCLLGAVGLTIPSGDQIQSAILIGRLRTYLAFSLTRPGVCRTFLPSLARSVAQFGPKPSSIDIASRTSCERLTSARARPRPGLSHQPSPPPRFSSATTRMTRVRQRRPALLSAESLEAREVPAAYGPLQIDPTHYAASHILVKLNTPAALRSPLASGAEAMGGGLYCIDLKPGVTVARALRHFRAQRGVAFAEPDFVVHADVIPNDPSFGSLYGLNNTGQGGGTPDADIDAPEAWDVSTGSGNMVVAIIDTGVDYNHPDLAANIWTNPGEIPGNGIDDEGDGFVDDVHGYDFVNNDGDPMDDNGHGTHVAGTIGAVGDNGIGVAGVNWHVQIMALKFLGANGSGPTSGAINALNFAVAHGVKISNNSWGGGGFSSALNTAINNARAAGHLFIAAAGNNGSNNDSLSSYPSNYPQDNVLAVAATDRNDHLASFSNFGATTVDLAAPGVSILSTYPGNRYATLSGTSMATPHVTGAAALVWDAHPDWTYLQVVQALKSTVDVKPNLVGKMVTGGRLNVNAPIHFGTTPPADTTGPRVTASAFSVSGNTISSVRLTFSEAINAASFDATDVSFTGPSGAVAIAGVTPVSATQFDVTF